MDPFLDALSDKKETAGVCVLGSFALTGFRPYADDFSDFDVAIFLDLDFPHQWLPLPLLEFQSMVQPLLPEWLPNFKFHFPGPDPERQLPAPRLQINVHQLVLGYELDKGRVWPGDRREAFANTCDLVFDRDGRVSKLIALKSAPPVEELQKRVSDSLALIPVTLEHSVEKCLHRKQYADAQLALAEAVLLLIDLLYALNGCDLPHQKWRLSLASNLQSIPTEFQTRARQVILSENPSIKLAEFRTLYDEVKALVPSHLLPESDPYRKLITQVRPGFQLRHLTAADKFADIELPATDQYQRMANDRWNRINFDLNSDGDN